MFEKLPNTCPMCGAGSHKTEYHSYFDCGSYYTSKGNPVASVEKKEGYYLHDTLECARRSISVLDARLSKAEEYIKKQTEIPKKKLKSLTEHNEQAFNNYAAANNLNSGFACPDCGEELFYVDNSVIMTYPAKRAVDCRKCKYTGYVY